jgi:hypothetical protein
MIALVAVGWVAGRRGAPVRRRWFIAATVALLGILVLGVTSLAVLPDGHSDQRSGAQRDG